MASAGGNGNGNGNGNGGAMSNLVEGTIAKVVARIVFPAILTGAIGMLTWYIKSASEKSDAHTVQLERVMSNQDRLADRVSAALDATRQSITDTRRVIDDHEARLRSVERRAAPTGLGGPP